ncbi:MAG TPA: glycosyl transferase family 2 [Acidimicrobiaceae bacterium]|mgnify:FL=1|nr:glycosyl transferase family 2 [Acidimicrobiaceae bacterium]HAQ22888.1 glycosyl transferase family 2 [Acidimicrobiaceae bacterium]HCV35086.1 glycosyl transferase family 2 [Acidimicrobiaceae bacterium]
MNETFEPACSIVIPARDEASAIMSVLERIVDAVTLSFECVVVVDDESDTTHPVVADLHARDPRFRIVVNDRAPGPANAIRYGVEASAAPVIVVTMADGSDDPRAIDDLVRLIERGVVIAAASRYMAGGQQVGAPFLKSALSRMAGLTLCWFARVGTHDATNSFKAYDRSFLEDAGIDSEHGFEMGIELVAKARRARLPVAEIPTIWIERSFGASNFQVRRWLMRYLRWYLVAFGIRRRPRSSGHDRARATSV